MRPDARTDYLEKVEAGIDLYLILLTCPRNNTAIFHIKIAFAAGRKMVVRSGSSQAKFILTDFIHWIDVYMSRLPKDKLAEEISVSTVVTSQGKGRTKLRPVDRPRYVMSLSEASNPYKGQTGEMGQSVTSTINCRKKDSLSLSTLRFFTLIWIK